MAKYSGRVRIFLILTILIKTTLADRDPLSDPSLELIKLEDEEEGIRTDLDDPTTSNKGEKRFLETLLCKDPKSPNNIVKVLKGTPNHLYSTIEVSCPNGQHFANGQEAVNVTCLPLPDPCYCKASWETLDKYLLVDDFNCTGPNPVPCRDPTPENGALEVVSGVPFVILNITVKAKCLHGLQFPDGTTEITSKCLPAPTPYHITGFWIPEIPYKCIETLQCPNPKTADNTVKALDGDPFHMNSKVQVSCTEGRHFENGLDTVNVTCLPLPHPCMCMAAWTRQSDYQLMYNFNCTESRGTQKILPQPPPIEEGDTLHKQEIEETNISPERQLATERETAPAEGTYDKENNEISIPVETNSGKNRRSNEIDKSSKTEVVNENYESDSQIYENGANIYHRTGTLDNKIPKVILNQDKESIPNKGNLDEENSVNSEELKADNSEEISSSNLAIESNAIENPHSNENEYEVEPQSQSNEIKENVNYEEESEGKDIMKENENTIENEVQQIEQPPIAVNANEYPEEIAEEDETDEAELSESNDHKEADPVENNEEREHDTKEISLEENESEHNEDETEDEEDWNEENHAEEELPNEENNEYNREVETSKEEEEVTDHSEEEILHEEEEVVDDHDDETNREPEEEKWEGETSDHSSGVDENKFDPTTVVLDETLPMKGTNIITDEFSEHMLKNEEEVFDSENNELDEETEIEEEKEQELESHKSENPTEIEVPEVIEVAVYEDDGVERPGPLHEVQQTPFHRTDDKEGQMKTIENEDDPCLLPPDSGYGKRVHTRYFFNSSLQECDSFIYGGSGGNKNNFQTAAECMDVCYTQKS